MIPLPPRSTLRPYTSLFRSLTQMGHEIARKVGMTMIGRATNRHFLLFTGAERFQP